MTLTGLKLVVVTIILLASACSSTRSQANTVPMETIMNEGEKNAGVEMTATANVDENKLAIHYQIRNTLPHSIYVFDEMIAYDSDGRPNIDRATAYCFWEEPNTLRVVRAMLRMPLEKEVYSLEIPYAREVKSQAEITGGIELDVPVKEKSPFYGSPTEDTSKTVDCTSIRLIVGWTEPRDGNKITEATIGGENVLRIRGNWQPKLLSEDLSVSVSVITHTDTFDRQMPQN